MVSLLLIGGVAALGAASPNDVANENATASDTENMPDDAGDAAANESAAIEASPEDARGADVDIPEQAPDHVSDTPSGPITVFMRSYKLTSDHGCRQPRTATAVRC